jgi:hypothetical protein
LIVSERVLALAVTSWGTQEPAMPRYHFNVRQGTSVIRDEEGEEFPDLESAQFEARMSAREMLLECIESGCELDGREIEIVDESDKVIGSMKVRDVLKTAADS